MELEQNGNYEKGYFNGISDILIVDDCLGIGFILNYYLVIKYSIEDCLPLGGKGTFPVVSDRLDEIHALVNYAEIVVIYAIYALSLAVYWLLNINKK